MKKILTLILALMLILSIENIALGEKLDYEGSWAKEEIIYMMEMGIINGYPDGTFRPANNMAKSEFYKLVNGLMGYTEKAEVEFLDVKTSDWYFEQVQKGLKANYILRDELLDAKSNINRGEVARSISLIFNVEENENAAEEFKDNKIFTKELKGIIGGLKKNKIIKGLPDGTFSPDAEITRAEVVKILHDISGEIVNTTGIVSKDIKSNMLVNTGEVLLKDMSIKGNLYLTEGIGKGHIYIENVHINGELTIQGGGVNSIVIKNSNINRIIIEKPEGEVKAILENTKVNELKVLRQARLELIGKTKIEKANFQGKIDLKAGKDSLIVSLNVLSKEISIDSKGTIQSINSKQKVQVNGEILETNREFNIVNGKIEEISKDDLSKPNKPDAGSPEGNDQSMSSLLAKYRDKLSSLQSNTEASLDSLLAQAQAEIDQGVNIREVYDRYEPMAKKLEANTDSQVSLIIIELEYELKENGYHTEPGTDLYKEYESIKSDYENKLILP